MAQGSCPTASHQAWDCVKPVLRVGGFHQIHAFCPVGSEESFTVIPSGRKANTGPRLVLDQNLLPSSLCPPVTSPSDATQECPGLSPQVATSLCGVRAPQAAWGWFWGKKEPVLGGTRESSGPFYNITCKCWANKMQIKTQRSSTERR